MNTDISTNTDTDVNRATEETTETQGTGGEDPLYFSYTDRQGDDSFPFFASLADRAAYDQAAKDAQEQGLRVTELQARSAGAELPPLEIVCITNHRISSEEASRISQSALSLVVSATQV
ncbi:MAG: hypothetical protein V4671_11595 [Armatimonadota bacterium]